MNVDTEKAPSSNSEPESTTASTSTTTSVSAAELTRLEAAQVSHIYGTPTLTTKSGAPENLDSAPVPPAHLAAQFHKLWNAELPHLNALQLDLPEWFARANPYRRQLIAHLHDPASTPAPASAKQEAQEKKRAEAETGTPLEDAPLAEWTADQLKGLYCWSAGRGSLTYRKGVWKDASEAASIEMVRKKFKQLHQSEIAQGAGFERQRRLASLHSASKIRAVAGLLKGILEVDATIFDNRPDLLNAVNGVIDLPTGTLLEHSPAYYFTKITGTEYRANARHLDWRTALQAMPDDVAPFMQVRFGQAATGHPVPDDIMPVLQGDGENGKSTVMAAIEGALGDHATYVPERLLLSNPSDHPTELTTLQGTRAAFMEETPEARQLNIKRLKDVLGSTTMTARRIRQDPITWKTTHTLFLTSNYRPKINETDNGTWRRLALVRFPYTFVKPGQPLTEPHHRHGDQGLRDRLQNSPEAMQAVLAWIVEGAQAWYANGKTMPPLPEQVRADTEEWRGESDAISSYLAEHIEFDGSSAILSSELLQSVNEWLKGQGQMPWGAPLLTARLESNADMKRHPTKKRRVNNPTNLSRLIQLDSPAKFGKETVWEGLKFSR